MRNRHLRNIQRLFFWTISLAGWGACVILGLNLLDIHGRLPMDGGWMQERARKDFQRGNARFLQPALGKIEQANDIVDSGTTRHFNHLDVPIHNYYYHERGILRFLVISPRTIASAEANCYNLEMQKRLLSLKGGLPEDGIKDE